MLKRIFSILLSASVVLSAFYGVDNAFLPNAYAYDISEPAIYFFKGFDSASDLDTLKTEALSKSETRIATATIPENSGYFEISSGVTGATSGGAHVYFTDAEFKVKENSPLIFEMKMRYKLNTKGYITTWDTVSSQRAKTFSAQPGGIVRADEHTSEPVIATLSDTEEWHTWAMVYSNESPERRIYLDGELIATKTGDAGYDGRSENYYYKNKYFVFRILPYFPNNNSYVHYDYFKAYTADIELDVKAKTNLYEPDKLTLDFNYTVVNLSKDMISLKGNPVKSVELIDMNEQTYQVTFNNSLESSEIDSLTINGVTDSTGRTLSGKKVTVEKERALSASTPKIIQNGEIVNEYDYSELPIKAASEIKNISNESKSVSLYLNAYGYDTGSDKKLLVSTVKNADVKAGETLRLETDELELTSGITEIKAFVWENLNSVSGVGTAEKYVYTSSVTGFPSFGTYIELGNVSFAKKTGAASTGLTKLGYRTYVAMIGTPAYVFEFDTHSGKYINSYECGSGLQHAVKVGSDGKVYVMITGSPDLYVYDPETQVNKLIQADCCQGTSVWSMNYGADGDKSMLYMPVMSSDYVNLGTSVVEYDIDAGKVTVYDGFDKGCKYAHCATGDESYVYVGSASSGEVATISKMDKKTKEIVTWENDTSFKPGSVTFIKVIGDYIFTRFGDDIIVLDKSTMQKIDQFTGGRGQGNCISDPDPSNPDLVYYNTNGGNKLNSYNLKTREHIQVINTPTTYGNIVRYDFGRWIPDENGVVGITGLGGSPDKPTLFHLVPETKIFKYLYCAFETGFPGVPTKPNFLYVSRDDKLYVGGYEAGLNGYDLKTNSMIFSVENGNQHGMTMVNGKLFGGSYGNDAMYMYDPQKTISSSNPRKIASPSGVNRYYHTTDTNAGFGLSVGIADYGNPQGSVILVTYLNGAGKMKNYVGVIPGENINGVDYRNGYIYASSSINVPQHEDEWSEEAHVAKIDARTGETVLMTTVNFEGLPKTTQIGEIKFGPDGLLYGLANAGQTIFAMSPEDLSVVRYHSFYPEENPAATYQGEYLEFGAEGNLYAIISGTLHMVNPETFETEILWEKCDLFRLDNDGNILKRRGTNSSGIVLTSIPVNKRQRLEIMINNAKKYYKEAEYSAQSWAVFKEALAAAEAMDIKEAYLPDVEALARKLTFAIKDLQTVYDYEAGFAYPFK